MADHVIADPEDRGLVRLPACLFFSAYLQKHPAYAKAVHPTYLGILGIRRRQAGIVDPHATETEHAVQPITFMNRGIQVVGDLHVPKDFDPQNIYQTLVLTMPGSSVKEQIGGIYAAEMAKRGFVALTFDPSFQGQSGGEPRGLEDPRRPRRGHQMRRRLADDAVLRR